MECGPLSDEERKRLEEDLDEDASAVAEKIRVAVYEGEEGEMEYLPEPEEDGERETGERETGDREPEAMGEMDVFLDDKETGEEKRESITSADYQTEIRGSEVGEDFAGMGNEEESGGEIASKEGEGYGEMGSRDDAAEESSGKEREFSASRDSTSVEQGAVSEEEVIAVSQEISRVEEKIVEDKSEEKEYEEMKKEKRSSRKIKLEDIEESIRKKIEERLDEDEESGKSDEGFEELGSYLLKAAARVKEYTAEEIGYRIFKKYERQEVPGIGPRVDQSDIEKVIDFMDYSSNSQEGMVMPRNIRHWMCPPLEKLPLPEP